MREGRAIGLLALMIFYLTAFPTMIAAHEDLISSFPAPGEILTGPPLEIRLTFSGEIGADSTLTVFDEAFIQVPLTAYVDPEQPADLVASDLGFPNPGSYTVQWEIVSEDEHPLTGSFTFSIAATGDFEMTELIAAAESEAVNLPGWFAWLMVILALVTPILVGRMARRR